MTCQSVSLGVNVAQIGVGAWSWGDRSGYWYVLRQRQCYDVPPALLASPVSDREQDLCIADCLLCRGYGKEYGQEESRQAYKVWTQSVEMTGTWSGQPVFSERMSCTASYHTCLKVGNHNVSGVG